MHFYLFILLCFFLTNNARGRPDERFIPILCFLSKCKGHTLMNFNVCLCSFTFCFRCYLGKTLCAGIRGSISINNANPSNPARNAFPR